MRPRIIELRGLPAMLLISLVIVAAGAVLALLLMVGAAVAVAGLALSAGAALFYTLRRKLFAGTRRDIWLNPATPPTTANTSLEVRQIEVEVLPRSE